ncbi:MAG: extracellular solute-binding protein [Roseburia sp.]|nr:extracellular solute-binding protein [Roseburia sp.]MCM1097105.1 extracellular solute-binding protein [Ruminococcus flavefaciens]
MKRKMFRKLMAASLAAVMTVSLAACGNNDSTPGSEGGDNSSTPESKEEQPSDSASSETPSEEDPVGLYTVLTDENGNTYDLGGMEIIVRDWWSSGEVTLRNDYEEARQAYREWCMDTYNFTIKQISISDWGSAPQDFVDYVTTGGDDNNYVFVLREDASITAALDSGLMYDLNTLDCLDFSEKKFTDNNVHLAMSRGDYYGCMYTGKLEPRDGFYFNKRLLTEAGIDPADIYAWQESGEWTWDKFEEVLETVQRDIDNDGVIDVWGFTGNSAGMWLEAACSNGGEWVGMDETGHYTYRLEDPETLEALNWFYELFNKYRMQDPTDAQWDYYKEAFITGKAAFCMEGAYCAGVDGQWSTMTDEYGFVCWPKGPRMDDYMNVAAPNPLAIPACYDADKAWKIAFAYNLYTDPVPGWEDYEGWMTDYLNYGFDMETMDYTIPRMIDNIVQTYSGQIQNLDTGNGFTWNFPWEGVSAPVERMRDAWKSYIDATNARVDSNQ